MRILICGEMFRRTSFANINSNLAVEFHKLGHEAHVCAPNIKMKVTPETMAQFYPQFKEEYSSLFEKIYHEAGEIDYSLTYDAVLYFLVCPVPENHHIDKRIKSKRNIFYTVWSHQNVPESWAPYFDKFDMIWTPSKANTEATKLIGSKTPIMTVPHGYDPNIFSPREKKDDGVFRFGVCNSVCDFKGADTTIRAFMEEFSASDNVELWLNSTSDKRTLHEREDEHGYYYHQYLDILNEYPQKQLPTYYTERSRNSIEMANLYHQFDCIVSPHRGEGFGLVGLEALACGIPAIMSRYHGPLDYVLPEYPYFVDGEMSWTIAEKTHFPDGGDPKEIYRYFEPNKDSLKKTMRKALEDHRSGNKLETRKFFTGSRWSDIAFFISEVFKEWKKVLSSVS